MNIQVIELFGKSLFSLVEIPDLVQFPTNMPSDEAAFVFILEGHCHNYTDLEDFDLKAGNAVLAKSGNGVFKTHEVNGNRGFKAISIRFHKDVLEELYQMDPYPFFESSAVPVTTNSVKIESDVLVRQYVESILIYFNRKESIGENLLILKLKELIAILLHTTEAANVKEVMSNLFEKRTYEFKEVVKAHIFSSISITDLARLTHNSLSSFKKEFKRVFNDTPGNYLINRRIEKVAELLPNTQEPITLIAYHCEFKTLAHMSRVFKARYGVSPSEYRENFLDKR